MTEKNEKEQKRIKSKTTKITVKYKWLNSGGD